MTEPTDHESETRPADTEFSTVTQQDDVDVEKTVTNQPDKPVEVSLTIRSSRNERCDVRVVDPLPDPVREEKVGFHPDCDPSGWSPTEEAVVFEGPLGPEAERTMVYQVLVDRPSDRDQFSADPTVAVTPIDGIFEYWSDDGSDESDDTHPSSGFNDAAEPEAPSALDSSEQSTADDRPDTAGGLDDDRQPTDGQGADERAIREAIDEQFASNIDGQLETLRGEVQALSERVDACEQQSHHLDRIDSRLETLSDDLEEQLRSLAADLETLEEKVERGVRWRSTVNEAIVLDPDEE